MYTATMKLSDGRVARLSMPDFYAMLTDIGDIPSPEIAAVIQLLDGSVGIQKADLLSQLKSSADHYIRLYTVAAACIEWPRLILVRRRCRGCAAVWDTPVKRCTSCQRDDAERIAERGPDELGPRGLSFREVQDIYVQFFLGENPTITATTPDDAGGLPAAAPARNGVPHDAEPLFTDR